MEKNIKKTPDIKINITEHEDGSKELIIGTPESEDLDAMLSYVDHLRTIIDLLVIKNRSVRTANDDISLQPSNRLNYLVLEDVDSIEVRYSSGGEYTMILSKGSVERTFTIASPVKYISTKHDGYEVHSSKDEALRDIRR